MSIEIVPEIVAEVIAEPQEAVLAVESVLAAFAKFGSADLFKVIRKATAEAEKKVKEEAKGPKKPKGPTPPQLKKPKEWVGYALKYATENGWDSFKAENKKTHEEIIYPASELKEGKYVFPNGKPLILTQAMSLSKQMFNAKLKKGSHEAVYREFEAWLAAQPVEAVAAVEAVPKAPLIRKTMEEKAAEAAAKKEAAEKVKAEKKAATAAQKEAAKAAKAAEKGAAVPKAAVKAAAVPATAMAGGLKPGPKKKAAAAAAVEELTCPKDDNVYPWPYKGKDYFRNHEHQVWEKAADGGLGDWAGVFIFSEDRIDETAADPFADEE
jgi:hypothetical protein